MERWRRDLHDEDMWCEIKPQPGPGDDARAYYYNESTHASSWALPVGVRPKAAPGPEAMRPSQPTTFAVGTRVWVPDETRVVNTAVVEGEAFAPGQAGTVRMDPTSNGGGGGGGGGSGAGRRQQLSPQATARIYPFDEQLLNRR